MKLHSPIFFKFSTCVLHLSSCGSVEQRAQIRYSNQISWSAKLMFDLRAPLKRVTSCVQFVITVGDELKIANTNFIAAYRERDI